MNEALVEMMEYNRWADRTLFEACRALGPETLAQRPAGISGTIGELLTHIAGGEQTFVLRAQGRQHEGELTRASPFPGVETLLHLAGESSEALAGIARGYEEGATVDLPYGGTTYRFPLSFILLHAVEHSMEHRTEVKVGLNQLGIETPDLDGWSYALAKGYGEEV